MSFPVALKRGHMVVTTAPHGADLGQMARESRGIATISLNSGHGRYDNVAQRLR